MKFWPSRLGRWECLTLEVGRARVFWMGGWLGSLDVEMGGFREEFDLGRRVDE